MSSTDPSGLASGASQPFPQRSGPRPRTTPTNPHQQIDQNAPPEMQEKLYALMRTLPDVLFHPSDVAPDGSRAVSLPVPDGMVRQAQHGRGRFFMINSEFAHLHSSYDGSLHMALGEGVAAAAIAAGWAEFHPMMRRMGSRNIVLVYGPRDDEELQVAWHLVRAAHDHARGAFIR